MKNTLHPEADDALYNRSNLKKIGATNEELSEAVMIASVLLAGVCLRPYRKFD